MHDIAKRGLSAKVHGISQLVPGAMQICPSGITSPPSKLFRPAVRFSAQKNPESGGNLTIVILE